MARIVPDSPFRRGYQQGHMGPSNSTQLSNAWASPEGVKTAVGITDVVGGTITDAVQRYKKKADVVKSGGDLERQSYANAMARAAAAKTYALREQALAAGMKAWDAPGSGLLSRRWSGGPEDTVTTQFKRVAPRLNEDSTKATKGRGGKGIGKNLTALNQQQARIGDPTSAVGQLGAVAAFNRARGENGIVQGVPPQFWENVPSGLSGAKVETYLDANGNVHEVPVYRLKGTPEQEKYLATLPKESVEYKNIIRDGVARGRQLLEANPLFTDPRLLAHFQAKVNERAVMTERIRSLHVLGTPDALAEARVASRKLSESPLSKGIGHGFSAPALMELIREDMLRGRKTADLLFPGIRMDATGAQAAWRLTGKYPEQSKHDEAYLAAATDTGIPFQVVQAMAFRESSHGVNNVSTVKSGRRKGEQDIGILQTSPEVARRFGLKVGHGVDERRDPYKSALAGARYLKSLKDKYKGNMQLALMAYNWGPHRLDKQLKLIRAGKRDKSSIPELVRRYAKTIMAYANNGNVPPRGQSVAPKGATQAEVPVEPAGMSMPRNRSMPDDSVATPTAEQVAAPNGVGANDFPPDESIMSQLLGGVSLITEEPLVEEVVSTSTPPVIPNPMLTPAATGTPPVALPVVTPGMSVARPQAAPVQSQAPVSNQRSLAATIGRDNWAANQALLDAETSAIAAEEAANVAALPGAADGPTSQPVKRISPEIKSLAKRAWGSRQLRAKLKELYGRNAKTMWTRIVADNDTGSQKTTLDNAKKQVFGAKG